VLPKEEGKSKAKRRKNGGEEPIQDTTHLYMEMS
jgi:hypothetical protein